MFIYLYITIQNIDKYFKKIRGENIMAKEKNVTKQYFWAFMVLALLIGSVLGFVASSAVSNAGQAMNFNACKTYTIKCMDNYQNMNENQQDACKQKIMGCMIEDGFSEWFNENYGETVQTFVGPNGETYNPATGEFGKIKVN